MAHLLNPQIELLESNPEVKSYIYQQLMEFEPYVTPDTVLAVTAKNPRKLALQYESENKDFDMKELSKMYRIAISISEEGHSVSAEGVHHDIYSAIKLAKDNLMLKLMEIHDSVVSQQDRIIEINHIMQSGTLH